MAGALTRIRRWWSVLRDAITGPLITDLSDTDRTHLENAAHSGRRDLALRAEILLAATEPVPSTRIARRLGVSQRMVLRVVRDYRRGGAFAAIS